MAWLAVDVINTSLPIKTRKETLFSLAWFVKGATIGVGGGLGMPTASRKGLSYYKTYLQDS